MRSRNMYWIPLLLLPTLVGGSSPTVALPINSQMPPVGRVGEFFSYQFPESTFQPSGTDYQYSMSGAPTWLSLDGSKRTLLGTPGKSDAGSTSFSITATNSEGSTVMHTTLVVTDSPGPKIGRNISDYISKSGVLSGPASLAMHTSTPFRIQLAKDIFATSDQNIDYMALSADHTSLPSWLSFDSTNLSLTGTTPSYRSPPDGFKFIVIASNIDGFAGATVPFSIISSDHVFHFNSIHQVVNFTTGDKVSVGSLRDNLILDDKPISDDDLANVLVNSPNWLSFDSKTLNFSGSPPSGTRGTGIDLTAYDRYGDTAKTHLEIRINSPYFDGTIGVVNAIIGKDFSYTINKSFLLASDLKTKVDFKPPVDWLKYNPDTLTVSGKIARDTNPQDIVATITGTSASHGDMSDSLDFTIHVTIPGMEDRSATSNPHAGYTDSSLDGVGSGHSGLTKSKKIAIAAASIVGGLIIFVSALFCCLCTRRKRQQKRHSESYISRDKEGPMTEADQWQPRGRRLTDDEGHMIGSTETSPDRPPRLHLDLGMVSPSQEKKPDSFTSSIGDGEANILEDFSRSTWGCNSADGKRHAPHESMKVATEMARSRSGREVHPRRTRPRSMWVYNDSIRHNHHEHGRYSRRSIGMPANRYLAGVGQGRHSAFHSPSRSLGSGPPMYRRPSYRNSYSSYSTQSTTLLSPSGFHGPFHMRYSKRPSTDRPQSIRVVQTNEDTIERRQSYVRKRASHQPSPFFGAGSSRASSLSCRPTAMSAGPVSVAENSTQTDLTPKPKSSPSKSFKRSMGILTPRDPNASSPRFPGSLRKHRSQKSVGTANSHASSPRRSAHGGMPGNRASIASSFRSSKIFELPADPSLSCYSHDLASEAENMPNSRAATPGKQGKKSPFRMSPLKMSLSRARSRTSSPTKMNRKNIENFIGGSSKGSKGFTDADRARSRSLASSPIKRPFQQPPPMPTLFPMYPAPPAPPPRSPLRKLARQLTPRTTSGNVADYASNENPSIVELSTLGVPINNTQDGPFPAQESKLVGLVAQREQDSPAKSEPVASSPRHHHHHHQQQSPQPQQHYQQQQHQFQTAVSPSPKKRTSNTPGETSPAPSNGARSPLSLLTNATAARVRVIEGKSRSPGPASPEHSERPMPDITINTGETEDKQQFSPQHNRGRSIAAGIALGGPGPIDMQQPGSESPDAWEDIVDDDTAAATTTDGRPVSQQQQRPSTAPGSQSQLTNIFGLPNMESGIPPLPRGPSEGRIFL